MLTKVKMACRVSTDFYDEQFIDLIRAGVADLKLIGIEFDTQEVAVSGEVVDIEITDPLVMNAVTTYVRMNFGSPDDFDRLKAAYDMQKGQLRETSGYGLVDAAEESEE